MVSSKQIVKSALVRELTVFRRAMNNKVAKLKNRDLSTLQEMTQSRILAFEDVVEMLDNRINQLLKSEEVK